MFEVLARYLVGDRTTQKGFVLQSFEDTLENRTHARDSSDWLLVALRMGLVDELGVFLDAYVECQSDVYGCNRKALNALSVQPLR